jgi:DNA-binding LacI/PurR family transcriptional regulator
VHGVDGVLVIAPYDAGAQALVNAATDIPLVAVEAGPPVGVPVIEIDQFAGAVAATQHLLELGHENVWHVTGPLDFVESRRRLDGWRHTLAQAGIAPPDPLVGDWSPRAGYELGRKLSTQPEVTAVFVANDQMALGLLRAMSEAGREVPRQVSVVGFDNVPEAPFFNPPLTTVRQDFDAMGGTGVRYLIEMIESESEPELPGPLMPELVVRGSTARR